MVSRGTVQCFLFVVSLVAGLVLLSIFTGTLTPDRRHPTTYQLPDNELATRRTLAADLHFQRPPYRSPHSVVPKAAKGGEPDTPKSPLSDGQTTSLQLTTQAADETYIRSIPEWWLKSWQRSAVHKTSPGLLGDEPFFPACTSTPRVNGSTTYPIEPEKYLRNSKNPCWYQGTRLRCVPYVYLPGVAKCGTSDLSRRLTLHPQVLRGETKEFHWWEISRFKEVPFNEYLDNIVGDEISELKAELKAKGSSVRIVGDYTPSYLWSPHYWQLLHGNEECKEPRVIHAHHIHHLNPDARLILTFRHPTPRLYSRFVSRIPRTPHLKDSTSEDFHRYVEKGIEVYTDCFKRWSIRQCAYNMSLYDESVVRLVEGMYPVFMYDWLRVWPREQMFIMRYEDYGGSEGERITEVYDFLGLARLHGKEMKRVLEWATVNSGAKNYERTGQMMNETKTLLDNFYRPFILMFAELLKDKLFLWTDI